MKKKYNIVLFLLFSFIVLTGENLFSQILISGFSPQNNKTSVPLNQVISITFSTPLDTSVHKTRLNNKWLPISFFSNIDSFKTVSLSSDFRTINLTPVLLADSSYFFCVASAFGANKVRLTTPAVFYFTTGTSFPPFKVSGNLSSTVSGVTVGNSIVALTTFMHFFEDENIIDYMAVVDNQGNFVIPHVAQPAFFGYFYIRATKDLNQDGIFDYKKGDVTALDAIVMNSADVTGVSLVYNQVFLEPPTLLTPADNAVNVAIPVTLTWTHTGGATNYWMQISTEEDFRTTIDTFGIQNTSWRVSNLIPSTKYYWRGYALDDIGGFSYVSSTSSFTTVAGLPPAPVLSEPLNGALAQQRDVNLSWTRIAGIQEYNLQVSTTSAFTTKVKDTLITDGYSSAYIMNLNYATKYYWRVRAKNSAGFSPFSDVWNFTTLMGVPGPVTLVSPADNVQLSKHEVDLEWQALIEADNYKIQFSRTSNFAVVEYEDNPYQNTYRAGTLQPNTKYYWRVRGINSIGQGAWSLVRSFTTWKAPDLVVTNVTAPGTSYSGRNVEINWTVKNTGVGPTSVPDWQDYIYIQPDSIFNPNAADEIGHSANVSALNINESYVGKLEVTLPEGIAGKFYIFVYTDKTNNQAELSNDNNVKRSASIMISMTPPPDLTVSSFIIPKQTYNGKKVPVNFTIKNKGAGPTVTSSWYDFLYLSQDTIVDSKAIYLAGFHHQGILKKDSSYTIQDSVKIPNNAFGKYFLILVCDKYNDVYEYSAESNNTRVSDSMQVLVVATPDLAVQSITHPVTANSGSKIKVEWKVKNQGLSETFESGWYDRLYLSKSATLDEKSAPVLATVHHGGAVDVDSFYTIVDSFTIPNGLSGDYYLFVKTDFDNRVFEYTYDDNNLLKSSKNINITLTPWADLQVTTVTVQQNPIAGQPVQVTYQVKNAGTGSVISKNWSDRIYISTNPVWSPANALMLAEIKSEGSLKGQEVYSKSANVMLPSNLASVQYIHIVADYTNTIFENTAEDNNTLSSSKLDIKSYPPADYTVQTIIVPSSANSGRQIQIEWSVKNVGNVTPLATSWFDNVYYSADNQYSSSDILLGSFQNSNALRPGSAYTRSEKITIPGEASGTNYIIVITDAKNQINDSDPVNNQKLSSGIAVTSLPAPDLQLFTLTTPAEAYANQPINIQWTTKNNGPGNTQSLTWTDIIYISQDTIIDNYDKQLGSVQKSVTLSSGASYSEVQDALLPNYIAGKYYIILKTDAKNEVYEKTKEYNNIRYKAFNIISSPIVDLAVNNIVVPLSAQTGDEITITYTLKNLSANTAQGLITDAVYISADNKWEVTDPMLALNTGYVSILPGTSASMALKFSSDNPVLADAEGNVTGTVPGILQGSYYIIVKTNIKKNLPEVIDSNNTRASAQKMNIVLPELVLGVSKNSFVTSSEQQFYKIQNVTAGKTLKITLKSSLTSANSEVFVKLNTPPNAGDYDFSSSVPGPDQEIIIPETYNGTYYVFVRDRSLRYSDSTHFQILADYVNFSISRISPLRGGNTGEVTISVYGARFDQDCIISLVNKSGKSPVTIQKMFKDASFMEATFDMTGSDLALGTYDVFVKRKDGSEVILKDGFTLDQGTPMEVAVGYSPPSAILRGGAGNISLSFQNSSNIDIPFLNGVIVIPEGQKFTIYSDKAFTADKLAENPDYSVIKAQEYIDYDGWRIIPIFAKGLRVGEIMNVYLQVEDVQGDDFPIQAYANAYDRKSFVTEQAEFLEAFRQAILSDSAKEKNSELLYLAQSKEKFIREVFNIYIAAGIITPEDLVGISFSKISSSFAESLDETQKAALQKLTITSCEKAVMWATVAVKFAFGAMKLVLVPVTGGAALIFVAKTAWSIASTYNNIKKGKPSFLAKLICKYIPVIASKDPNDIIGPEGYGSLRWVSVSQTMPFTIRFENDPKLATAPAQVVTVTQQLDKNIDPKSFRLGSFGFGKYRFNIPQNASFYTQRVDVKESLKVYVDFEAGIDISTNTAFWTLRSIDPATGQIPVNPLMGFLSINDSLHSGEGFVTYSVKPKSTAKTMDNITSKASIVFDRNAAIETPAVYNTIDAGLPLSKVKSITTARELFNVSWEGKDDTTGSGLNTYSVYVSENDGPYKVWLTNVTTTDTFFVGRMGSTYKFYSIAKDNSGNFEPQKSDPDAYVTVTGVDENSSLPKEYALRQNYPNPFNPVTTIKYELPSVSRVTIRIYNILGEIVATLADGIQEAGVKQLQFKADQFASGIYIYEMDASSVSDGKTARFIKKMMLLK